MNISGYKSLPVRERLLLLIGVLIDEGESSETFSIDMRHKEAYAQLVKGLIKIPSEIRKIVLLSMLRDELMLSGK